MRSYSDFKVSAALRLAYYKVSLPGLGGGSFSEGQSF
jgi:hypothetical protein